MSCIRVKVPTHINAHCNVYNENMRYIEVKASVDRVELPANAPTDVTIELTSVLPSVALQNWSANWFPKQNLGWGKKRGFYPVIAIAPVSDTKLKASIPSMTSGDYCLALTALGCSLALQKMNIEFSVV